MASQLTKGHSSSFSFAPASKYQVPSKLFKFLGKESSEASILGASPSTSQRSLISPKSMLLRSKMKSQVLGTIPKILRDCVNYLRDDDRDRSEGLFRIPGDSEVVDKLLLMYDTEEIRDYEIFEREKPSAHDVATLMKRYLMRMANPLVDEQARRDLITIVQRGLTNDKDKQQIAYEVVVRCLEIKEEDRSALAFLLRFLLLISTDSEDGTRMTVENLSKMFAPIILRDDTMVGSQSRLQDQVKNIEYSIVATEILIWNADELIPK